MLQLWTNFIKTFNKIDIITIKIIHSPLESLLLKVYFLIFIPKWMLIFFIKFFNNFKFEDYFKVNFNESTTTEKSADGRWRQVNSLSDHEWSLIIFFYVFPSLSPPFWPSTVNSIYLLNTSWLLCSITAVIALVELLIISHWNCFNSPRNNLWVQVDWALNFAIHYS